MPHGHGHHHHHHHRPHHHHHRHNAALGLLAGAAVASMFAARPPAPAPARQVVVVESEEQREQRRLENALRREQLQREEAERKKRLEQEAKERTQREDEEEAERCKNYAAHQDLISRASALPINDLVNRIKALPKLTEPIARYRSETKCIGIPRHEGSDLFGAILYYPIHDQDKVVLLTELLNNKGYHIYHTEFLRYYSLMRGPILINLLYDRYVNFYLKSSYAYQLLPLEEEKAIWTQIIQASHEHALLLLEALSHPKKTGFIEHWLNFQRTPEQLAAVFNIAKRHGGWTPRETDVFYKMTKQKILRMELDQRSRSLDPEVQKILAFHRHPYLGCSFFNTTSTKISQNIGTANHNDAEMHWQEQERKFSNNRGLI